MIIPDKTIVSKNRTLVNDDLRERRERFKTGDKILKRYTVVEELGEGGMGVVYKCRDTVGNVDVAVKCLPPEVAHSQFEMKGILENYQLVRQLRHPNIVGVTNLEQDKATQDYYLVMDLAEGESLEKWRRQFPQGRVPLENALGIIRQIASALDYAHGREVMHRDIKPENIAVDSQGRVSVLDFGLAEHIRTSLSRVSMAVTSRSGTPCYKSPEQWRAQPQGAPADIYSLGVVAYALLAGRPPFESSDLAILRLAILSDPVPPIKGVPDHVNAALARALAKEPEDRFDTCAAFVAALEGKVKLPSRKTDGNKKSGFAKFLAFLALAAVAVGVWWLLGDRTKEPSHIQPPVPAPIVVTNEVERIVTKEVERVVTNEVERIVTNTVTLPPPVTVVETNTPPVAKPPAPTWEEVQQAISDCQFQVEIIRSGTKKYMDEVEPFRSMAGDFASVIAEIDKNWKSLRGMPTPTTIAEAEEIKGKANDCTKAIRDGLETLKTRRNVHIANALKRARGYHDNSLWERCIAECDKVLGWDAANEEAKNIKAAAESHLVPTAELEILVDGKPLGSGERVKIGSNTWTTPISWGAGNIKEGKKYGGWVEYSRGGKRYTGTLASFTVNWRGPKTFTVTLKEVKGPRNGECRKIKLPGGVEMEMVYVAPGSFNMGSESGEAREKPVHTVVITKGYWIGKYPVTQSQWASLVRANSVFFESGAPTAYFSSARDAKSIVSGMDTSDFPMAGISWGDCDAMVKAMNRNATDGMMYSLPSEAQWEFAARGGSESRGYTYSGGNNLDALGWYHENSGGRTHSVREKDVGNELGVVGMSGNVYEWCNDWYGEDYYKNSPEADPQGPASGVYRVLRGGGLSSDARFCRSAFRCGSQPGSRDWDRGFRLCCSAGPRE